MFRWRQARCLETPPIWHFPISLLKGTIWKEGISKINAGFNGADATIMEMKFPQIARLPSVLGKTEDKTSPFVKTFHVWALSFICFSNQLPHVNLRGMVKPPPPWPTTANQLRSTYLRAPVLTFCRRRECHSPFPWEIWFAAGVWHKMVAMHHPGRLTGWWRMEWLPPV